uniref:WGS project CBMI000000000 data, contig CS3069_c004588 n=1 Tax=Fusarium clavum TaxID=2594811 RepID=A0A090MEM2_9HYPO|nr:unnamed protein product [Fusarium clavum]
MDLCYVVLKRQLRRLKPSIEKLLQHQVQSSVHTKHEQQVATRGANSMPHVHPESHVLNEIIRPIQELKSPHFLQ